MPDKEKPTTKKEAEKKAAGTQEKGNTKAYTVKSMDSVLSDFSITSIGSLHNKPISTGVQNLDILLNGGFSSGLILLGAQPSMGKSTLALQIAYNIAKSGIPAYYYSIEMTRHSIAAKALARTIFCQSSAKMKIRANRFMTADGPNAFTAKEWDSIEEAQKALEEGFRNFYVIESLDKKPVSGKEIYEQVPQLLKKSGKEKCVVFVDYLQLLSYPSEDGNTHQPDMRTIVDTNLNYLKALASDCNIPIVVISSLSRSNNGSPVQTSDFKESGNIEYSADVLMAMQFTKTPPRKKNTDYAAFFQKEKSKSPRELDVIVLKQRYGNSGSEAKVSFDYYPETDYFTLAGTVPQAFGNLEEDWMNDCREVQSVYSDSPESEKKRQRFSVPPSERLPGRFYINNCKLIQSFYKQSDFAPCQKLTVNVTNAEHPKTCTVFVRQKLHFDYYDKIVCDAVSTLWMYYKSSNLKNDQVKINVNAVLACMSGNDTIRLKKGATSSKRESHLIDILEKLGNTEICIDQRKELSLRKSSDIGGIQGVYSGYILPVKRMAHTNDFLLDLTKEPPFYAYASNKNQVISLKMQYLTCKEELPKAQKGKKEDIAFTGNAEKAANAGAAGEANKGSKEHQRKEIRLPSNTDDVLQIKHLLNQRLQIMRHANNKMHGSTIKYYYASHDVKEAYEGFCTVIGITRERFASDTSFYNRIRQIHKYVTTLLDYYVSIGYIKGYTETKAEKGKRITGVKIEFDKSVKPDDVDTAAIQKQAEQKLAEVEAHLHEQGFQQNQAMQEAAIQKQVIQKDTVQEPSSQEPPTGKKQ